MWLLSLRDLQHRAGRVAQAAIAAGLLLTVALLVSGIADGFTTRAQDTVQRMHDGAWLVPDGSSGPFTSSSAFPSERAGEVEADGPVGAVAVLRSVVELGGTTGDVVLVGIDESGVGMPDDLDVPAAGTVVVADEVGVDAGASISIAGRTVEVAGTLDGMTMFAGTPLVFASLEVVQELAVEGQDVATVLLAPAASAAPDGFTALDGAAVADDALRLIEDAVGTIDLVRILLWVVAGLIIGTFVHLAALERRRDFAVLRAVGANTRTLAGSLAVQAVVIGLAAAVVALVLHVPLVPVFPLHVDVQTSSLVSLPVVALVIALLASAATLRRTTRVDPADAFGGR